MKDIVIFSLERANKLLKQGFRIVRITPNKDLSGNLVFYFEDTKELREHLKKEYNITIG